MKNYLAKRLFWFFASVLWAIPELIYVICNKDKKVSKVGVFIFNQIEKTYW